MAVHFKQCVWMTEVRLTNFTTGHNLLSAQSGDERGVNVYQVTKRVPLATGRGMANRLIRYSIRLKVDNLLSSLQSCGFPRD